jgi:hypothetical protein
LLSCALAAASRVASSCIKRQVDAAGIGCCSQTPLVLEAWLPLLLLLLRRRLEVPLLRALWFDCGHHTLLFNV